MAPFLDAADGSCGRGGVKTVPKKNENRISCLSMRYRGFLISCRVSLSPPPPPLVILPMLPQDGAVVSKDEVTSSPVLALDFDIGDWIITSYHCQMVNSRQFMFWLSCPHASNVMLDTRIRIKPRNVDVGISCCNLPP